MRHLIVRSGVATACALLLLGGLARAAEVKPDADASKPRLVGVVNVNTATPEELELLPGVGPARAKAIVEHRKAHGAFKSAGDLQAISGIGEASLTRMKPFVATSGKTTARVER